MQKQVISDKVKQRLEKIGMFTVGYAARTVKDLNKLSDKKRTGLDCATYGIERVRSLKSDLKESWFNWCYYLMRMIKDEEVDQLAIASLYAGETYVMAYFSKQMIDNNKDNAAMKVLFGRYADLVKGDGEDIDARFIRKYWVK
jgi:hypothetical protein